MIKIDLNNFLLDLMGDWVIFGMYIGIFMNGGPASNTPKVASVTRRLCWSWNDSYHDNPESNFLRFYYDSRQTKWRRKSKAWLRRCEDFGCKII